MPGPNPLASDFLETCRARVDAELDRCITRDSASGRLQEAMRYSVLGGGKRIRPALCLAAAKALGQTGDEALIPACAVELIHAYSLIHDDLPAMDDDELRRGRPTTHIAFDEATAILAGDALQALAFGWLAEAPGLPESVRLIMVRELARARNHAPAQDWRPDRDQRADWRPDHTLCQRAGSGLLDRVRQGIGPGLPGSG